MFKTYCEIRLQLQANHLIPQGGWIISTRMSKENYTKPTTSNFLKSHICLTSATAFDMKIYESSFPFYYCFCFVILYTHLTFFIYAMIWMWDELYPWQESCLSAHLWKRICHNQFLLKFKSHSILEGIWGCWGIWDFLKGI